ncbi:MAG: carbohydrate ABC transporter permease [Deltaproteobacteria bacterium]|nr:carbohydrate ABC transporter permease [Deltaproteobacteria bacterium]
MAKPRRRSERNWRAGAWQASLLTVTLFAVVVIIFPIIWMVFASIRPVEETLSLPPVWLPRQINLEYYEELFSNGRQMRFFFNSYVIAGLTAVVCLALGSLAAYGFSRFKIKGGRLILTGILALQMLPAVALIIPYYNMAQSLRIYNTYLALVVADSSFILPMTIWILKGYLDSIPLDLEEAAMVDGCTRLRALARVVMPLALPGLIATGTMAFLGAWNELLFAVILTTGPNVAPLTIGIAEFFTQFGRDWARIMTMNTVGSVPLMVVFIFLQRWVVQGMTAGAVK